MNVISTKAHGVIDYLMGIVLFASSWIFNLDINSPEGMIPAFLGLSAIVYSLFTNYEMSLSNIISMRTHLWLDEMAGIFLAVSPWLFNFSGRIYLPHVLLGVAELGLAIFTTNSYRTVVHHHRVTRHTATKHAHH